jgi:hypothetical protein
LLLSYALRQNVGQSGQLQRRKEMTMRSVTDQSEGLGGMEVAALDPSSKEEVLGFLSRGA